MVSEITEEDKNRTRMYKNIPQASNYAANKIVDLSDYLKSLKMKVTMLDRSSDNSQRAIQLINKTNQFNLNGIRRDENEISKIISGGGKLYTAHLADRNGEHGEVVSILIDSTNTTISFVMSCKSFKRPRILLFKLYP